MPSEQSRSCSLDISYRPSSSRKMIMKRIQQGRSFLFVSKFLNIGPWNQLTIINNVTKQYTLKPACRYRPIRELELAQQIGLVGYGIMVKPVSGYHEQMDAERFDLKKTVSEVSRYHRTRMYFQNLWDPKLYWYFVQERCAR